jgi:hypothetical protein
VNFRDVEMPQVCAHTEPAVTSTILNFKLSQSWHRCPRLALHTP